uniref:PIPK domain-containing protein n=1 Tax=Peronospora matthiolae TaxID=2874970 RepID=A0AAV1VGR8_9STRA
METCLSAAHKLVDDKLVLLSELPAVQLPLPSHDDYKYSFPSLQRIRSPSPTSIESDASVTSSFTNTSSTASVHTVPSAPRNVATTLTKSKVLEAKRVSSTSKAFEPGYTQTNLSNQDKLVRGGKTKLDHLQYNYTERRFKSPAGNVINLQHEQYALTYGMMCGIRDSAGLQKPFKQRLTVNDFMRVDKKVFRANARLQHGFKFKDYSPDVFRQVRRRFGIDSADYMLTLSGDFNFIEFMSNSKSGQFFFHSHDGRFMIKTQTKDDSKSLRRLLPHYYKFVMENPNTLITRFYGMHRVQMHHLRRKMHFVIMASVFNTSLEIHARFDLKGSRIGRCASAKEYEHGSTCVLKDNDLLDKGFRLRMSTAQRAIFIAQLRKDVGFLKRMKIMDYSILVGVHDSSYEGRNDLYTSTRASDSFESVTSQQEGSSGSLSASSAAFELNCVQMRSCRSNSMPERDAVKLQLPLTLATIADFRALRALSLPDTMTWHDSYTDFDLEDSDSELEWNGFASSEDGFSHSFSVAFNECSISGNRYSTESLPSTPGEAAIIPLLQSRPLDTTLGVKIANSFFCKDEGGICGRDQDGHKNGCVYFLGIIDILQQYNTRKIAETLFKGLRHNRKHISAVGPDFYGDRFIEYIEKHVV